ncbi:hypothetical protein [Flavobacterium cerinum]|uniref:Uncharacterized protein n=1 Tax=Flavobacterium cerinum TaxID=2502784 RepID=A0A3S3QHI0_9FLAO|nr:hypothetical protein [Flavobacterium cerinum]RWW96622.1 hypothetical protein EPI11_13565 [Flavobacterium cerinum]
MKHTITIFAAGLLLLNSCQKKEEKPETVVEETTIEKITETAAEKDMCFLQVISRDTIMLTITRDGDNISGTYKSIPFEKDKKTNVFKGTIKDNVVTAVGTVSAEGMTNKEEIIFTIDDKQASIKFGEMIEGDDGVYRYKNVNNTSPMAITKVDCK